ncbi:LysM domain-containing protein [Dioscorea alata]|uniref:LysM domain-containing protein n=1 Tax=Dioscorea alata TaxID=55571 RepID=A0ACB7V6M7_DIOAL|nr:LysM domain-containing protein [Dioscorea alata]
MTSKTLLLSLLLITTSRLLSGAGATSFSCSGDDRCHSLIGYIPPKPTTIAALQSLFQINPRRSLLTANSLPISTPPSFSLPSHSPIRIPIPCLCSNATGLSNHRPIYTVRTHDNLNAIARRIFNGFVTIREIADANNISDPDRIEVGRRLWIPLPCSCDEVDGKPVVHYGHVAAEGSDLESIAEEFGTTERVLMRVNGIQDPTSLQAGQILDIPLPVCSSSINTDALDSRLLLPNGSYTLTANNCIFCSCSSSTWQLDCHATQGMSKSTCPVAKCGNLLIGNTSTTSCGVSSCSYSGYINNNANNFTILTNLTTPTTCNRNEKVPLNINMLIMITIIDANNV